jgi:hypothetical protein
MGTPTQIVGFIDTIERIYNLTVLINITTTEINSTVNTIEYVTGIINATTNETNYIVKQLNLTLDQIANNTAIILNNTNQIINNTADIKELIDCDNVSDSWMCDALDSMNTTIWHIQNLTIFLNNTLSNITINLTVNLSDQNLSINVTPDLTNITLIIDDIRAELNCTNVTNEPNASICKRLIRIENNTQIINTTVNDINNLINYFNATIFGNITLQDIYDRITNITLDTSDLLTEIRRIREFDEELVFLVTDAFGMANAARDAAESGNLSEAADKLREANKKLTEAAVKLQAARNESQAEVSGEGVSVGFLTWVGVIVCLIIILGFYLFQKVPPEQEEIEKKTQQ